MAAVTLIAHIHACCCRGGALDLEDPVELVDFLRARLDEDEEIARKACEYAEASWKLDEEFGETVLWWPPEPRIAEKERKHGLPVVSDQWRGQTIESSGQRIAPHIARHDPARVLAEVEAKRAAIRRYEDARLALEAAAGTVLAGGVKVRMRAYTDVLRDLARPFRDHPDFDPAWLED